MGELTTLFKNTADAIRSKTGDTATMKASQFPAKIQGISVGISQDEADARYLRLSGGTMEGDLILNGAPTADNQAATKAYVDSKSGGINTLVYTEQIDFSTSNSAIISPTGIIAKKDILIELVFQNGTTFDTDSNDQYITINGAKIAGGYKLVKPLTSTVTCQYLLHYLATTNDLGGNEGWLYLGRNVSGSYEYGCKANAFRVTITGSGIYRVHKTFTLNIYQ